MRIRVLLFAAYRDIAGTDELTLEVPAGARAQEAVHALRIPHPLIPSSPTIAINRELSTLEEELADGDELALLPPVAGG